MAEKLKKKLSELDAPRPSLLARHLAEGVGNGLHRAAKRGSGIEFAGHREYSPGDDLRHLDRHALLRHGRHLIREFHTDTERAIHVVVDATASMNYASAPHLRSKKALGLLLGAALLVLGRRFGDPIGLSLIRGRGPTYFGASGASEQLERLLDALDDEDDGREPDDAADAYRAVLAEAGARIPKGASIVLFTDGLDDDPSFGALAAGLATSRRGLTVVQLLDPTEIEFPFEGAVRLRSPESNRVLDTDATRVRAGYLAALERVTENLRARVLGRGGRFLRVRTDVAPAEALHRVVLALRGEST